MRNSAAAPPLTCILSCYAFDGLHVQIGLVPSIFRPFHSEVGFASGPVELVFLGRCHINTLTLFIALSVLNLYPDSATHPRIMNELQQTTILKAICRSTS